MKKLIISIIILLLYPIGMMFSQQEGAIIERKIGTSYVFEDGVSLKEKPSTSSNSLASLKAGDKIEITGNTKTVTETNWVKDYWYKVSYENKSGYVWGYYLSSYFIKGELNNDNKEELLLVRSVLNSYPSKYQLKVIKGNEVVSEYEYQLRRNYQFYYELNFLGNKIYSDDGFNPKIRLFSIKYNISTSSGDDIRYIENFYFLDNKNKLQFAFSTNPYEDDCKLVKVLFPSDKDGITNKVIIKTICSGTCSCSILEEYKTTYIWNGKIFTID